MAERRVGLRGTVLAVLSLLPGLSAQSDLGELQRRAVFDLQCQPIIDEGRARIRQMSGDAEGDYQAALRNCRGQSGCVQRARDRNAERSRAIQIEEAHIARQVRDCGALTGRAQQPVFRPSAKRPLAASKRPTVAPSYPQTPDGDWVPPDQCRDMILASREKTRLMQNQESEAYRIERIQCAGDLDCLNRRKENAAERARTNKVMQAGFTREIRDCQIDAQPKIARHNANGDWLPDEPCDGFVDFAKRRVRKWQNAADEAYTVDRIQCGRDLACHQQARETAAQRQAAIRTEEARLAGAVQRCQIEAGARNQFIPLPFMSAFRRYLYQNSAAEL